MVTGWNRYGMVGGGYRHEPLSSLELGSHRHARASWRQVCDATLERLPYTLYGVMLLHRPIRLAMPASHY